jgi:hypothetical protein
MEDPPLDPFDMLIGDRPPPCRAPGTDENNDTAAVELLCRILERLIIITDFINELTGGRLP